MATNGFTVGEVAKLFVVAPNTVRNWCKWHGGHLSDSAKAKPRRFTELDLATFNLIAEYRSSGFTTATINEYLVESQVHLGEIIVPEKPQTPQIERDNPVDTQVPMVMLQAHTEALKRLTARLEQQHSAEVKSLTGEVATLRTWLLVQAAIGVVLIVAVVVLWVV